MEISRGTEACKYVWEGAIPLQIHLHESEVTTLPLPPTALILAPRIGYLPLLAPQVKPFFSSALPPGVDTVWFDYKGLPLKWYIPIGVLFDLLCAEPERPWNLTVHFRGYPGSILTPCEAEDTVKWSFINSLKEAAYIINGNCKNIMNMSQIDQSELWRSVLNCNLEAYLHVSSKLKLSLYGDDFAVKLDSYKCQQSTKIDEDAPVVVNKGGTNSQGRVPVRLYVRSSSEDFDCVDDAPVVECWDKISYINRPVEICEDDKFFTLGDAVKALLPEVFMGDITCTEEEEGEGKRSASEETNFTSANETGGEASNNREIKLVRIQGIEPKLEIPFAWVVKNLVNPEYFLHICVYIKAPRPITI
ncbi:unnamed protein product [Cuscuta epithymum]|uniref:Autophagy protein 5 n=1 Tax=Cuscuta epithymum TaxID=186058 RepID=A0AAV0C9Y3_9ASTE|nr:unnamed protein product [Cuscuta epithymum]